MFIRSGLILPVPISIFVASVLFLNLRFGPGAYAGGRWGPRWGAYSAPSDLLNLKGALLLMGV